MLSKNAKTSYPINELLQKRWSPRSFDPNKVVTRDQVMQLCEAARWAPSCFNDQPWRYLVFDKNHNESDYQKGFECLGEWNQKWAKNAPILLAVLSYDKFKKNQNPNRWSQYDTGAATENLVLQATSMGLVVHQMGGFDAEKVLVDFNIPEDYTAIAMIAIGYQAEAETLPEDYREMETKERERENLGQNFFDGAWGKGIV